MTGSRIPANRGRSVPLTFDGAPVEAYEGETVAAALIADGVSAFGVTSGGEPRAPFCNMGTCFDCVVTVDGVPLVRSCLTNVTPGMAVTTHRGAGTTGTGVCAPPESDAPGARETGGTPTTGGAGA